MGEPSRPDSDAVFRARGLTKVYRMGEVEVHALRGVDLDLYRGEFVVLLGPSGSGKSTLLNILGGLDVPTAGEVWYEGHHLSAADERALTLFRREHVGFVFQFYNLIPSLTARENVAIVTDLAEGAMRPEEALARVDLADRMDHFPAQLSGGQQQRVAIARAIAKRPAVLLCDEPTGALDSATGVCVLAALERVNVELGTTTVVITHNADIARMAHRVLYLGDGFRVEVEFEVARRGDVLQVASSALFREGRRWMVFRVAGGRARRVEVTPGMQGDGAVEILAGLKAGDRVVAYPDDRLGDGQRVRALEVEPAMPDER